MTSTIYLVSPVTLNGEAIRTHLIKTFFDYPKAKEYKKQLEKDLKNERFCKIKISYPIDFSEKKPPLKVQYV